MNPETGGHFRFVAQGGSWDAFPQLLSDSLLGVLMWLQRPDREASRGNRWNSEFNRLQPLGDFDQKYDSVPVLPSLLDYCLLNKAKENGFPLPHRFIF